MEKSLIKKICAAVIAIVVILILAAILLPKSAPVQVPTFKFLSGRTLTAQVETDQSGYRQISYVYSFEADFNDIVMEVNSELTALGYRQIPPSPQSYILQYTLSSNKLTDGIMVYIRQNSKMNVYLPPENSDFKIRTRYIYGSKKGWVSIEVKQRQQRNRFIVMFKQLFNKFHDPPE
jgi:hypothetical protein